MQIETKSGARWRVVGPYTAWQVGRGLGKRPRKIKGYAYWSPDGVERFVEGSRECLKEHAIVVCSNYGDEFANFV